MLQDKTNNNSDDGNTIPVLHIYLDSTGTQRTGKITVYMWFKISHARWVTANIQGESKLKHFV